MWKRVFKPILEWAEHTHFAGTVMDWILSYWGLSLMSATGLGSVIWASTLNHSPVFVAIAGVAGVAATILLIGAVLLIVKLRKLPVERDVPVVELKFDKNIRSCFELQKWGTPPDGDARCVRVFPVCSKRIDNCRGRLLGIWKMQGGVWVETIYRDAIDLMWTHITNPTSTVTLHPSAQQFLDVFYVHEHRKHLIPGTHGHPRPLDGLELEVGSIFRFDVLLLGDNKAETSISLQATITAAWSEPEVAVRLPG